MIERDLPPGLPAFLAVADACSFTAAAVRLGISPSAVSQQVRALERHLGAALLHRTTRSVSLTDAGERYRGGIEGAVDTIREAARHLADGEPRGPLRLTIPRTAFHELLRPVLPAFHRRYPLVTLELSMENTLIDVVREGFDAGIRFGHLVQQDMVAVRLGPDMRIAMLASPAYLDRRGRPDHPRDLAAHSCVGFRSATTGTIETWRMARGGEEFRFTPAGPFVVNQSEMLVPLAEDGLGIVEFVAELTRDAVAARRLEPVLQDWSRVLPGYHLYYPHRHRASTALQALRDMIVAEQRQRGDSRNATFDRPQG